MVVHQAQEALEHPDPLDSPDRVHPLGPVAEGLSHEGRTFQHPLGTPLHSAALVAVEMGSIGAEAAGIHPGMQGDGLHALIEDADQTGFPTHPDLLSRMFRRHRVEGLEHLNVPVPVNRPTAFAEHREQTGRQRPQSRALHLPELLADLPARGAVKPGVGHRPLPFRQMEVLLRQAGELPALDRVVLGVFDAGLDFSLVAGHRRPRRQHHRCVMDTGLPHLGVEFRLVPVGPTDRRPQIIDDQLLGNSSEVPKGVLQPPDESLGRLSPHHLAVALAGVAQDDPQQVGTAAAPVPLHHPGSLPIIHLGLLSRGALPPAKGKFAERPKTPHEALHRRVAPRERALDHQILVDPLRAQPLFHRHLDRSPMGFALTAPPRHRPGGRNGRLGCLTLVHTLHGAGGRNGWF